MLRPRIIPCLLIHDDGLVKTIRFKEPKYVGDPINAVKIFNEKEVDELIILDIDASVRGCEPNFKMIAKLAAECRMPLCYGGGISNISQAKQISRLGVEKVAISSIAVENPIFISHIAAEIGSQSVTVVLDVKADLFGKYNVWTHNGTRNSGRSLFEVIDEVESFGAGEIVINSIHYDGVMKGYDINLAKKVRKAINIPLTLLGGAGSLDDFRHLIQACGIVGAAAGSFFVFKGFYRAVLISYLSKEQKDSLSSTLLSANLND
jgi:cyclase